MDGNSRILDVDIFVGVVSIMLTGNSLSLKCVPAFVTIERSIPHERARERP